MYGVVIYVAVNILIGIAEIVHCLLKKEVSILPALHLVFAITVMIIMDSDTYCNVYKLVALGVSLLELGLCCWDISQDSW